MAAKIGQLMKLLGRRVSGRFQALFRLKLPACYHPNLGIFWGCLAFSEKNFIKKKTLRRSNHFLKFNGKSIFCFFKYCPKLFKKKLHRNMGILFSNLLSESILDFGKWSNWKYENMRICVFSV